MILALDAGNSNLVIGCLEDGRVLSSDRLLTDRGKPADIWTAELRALLSRRGRAPEDFEGSVLCCVVPALAEPLRLALCALLGREPLTISAALDTGLSVALDDPAGMGADLIATAVAALDRFPAPCAVIDMGTATTISVLDQSGRFLGGPLLPGLAVASDALAARAAHLPPIPLTAPARCISANTVDCMRSGAIFGYAGALDGLLDRIEAELGSPVTAVATGGLASAVVPWCRHAVALDGDLLLKGLWLLWRRNR